MSKPGNNYCDRAAKVFTLLHAKYGGDPNVMAIVRAGESICSAPASSPTPATPQPAGSRTPQALPTQGAPTKTGG